MGTTRRWPTRPCTRRSRPGWGDGREGSAGRGRLLPRGPASQVKARSLGRDNVITLYEVVQINLPDVDWRAVQHLGGVAFVSPSDFAACAGDVSWASFSIWVAVLNTSPSQGTD